MKAPCQMPSSASRAADAQPRCDRPRTTFGLPITTQSPAARAARPTSSAIGNSQMRAPRARNASAWHSFVVVTGQRHAGVARRRANPCDPGRDFGRARPTRSASAEMCQRHPRAVAVLRPATGSAIFLMIEGVWSLNATRCTRPAAISASATSSASRL